MLHSFIQRPRIICKSIAFVSGEVCEGKRGCRIDVRKKHFRRMSCGSGVVEGLAAMYGFEIIGKVVMGFEGDMHEAA